MGQHLLTCCHRKSGKCVFEEVEIFMMALAGIRLKEMRDNVYNITLLAD